MSGRGHPWLELNIENGLGESIPTLLHEEVTGACTFSSK